MDPDLLFVDTDEGRFHVGEMVKVKSGSVWTIAGFKSGKTILWFYVRHSKGVGIESYPYQVNSGPQFLKIKPKKSSKPVKEKPGLYFDRKKGFETVEADTKGGK
jgi:hypothetical protein